MEYAKARKIDLRLKVEQPLLDAALKLREIKPARKTIESMMRERCPNNLIVDALKYKFNLSTSKDVVKVYAKFLYDMDVVSYYDMARAGQLPEKPPVPGYMRASYEAFKQGVKNKDFNMDEALYHMFQQAFFRSQELTEYGWAGDEMILKQQKHALSVYSKIKENNVVATLPDEFQYEIEYPDTTAANVDEIEGYDPEDDPNE